MKILKELKKSEFVIYAIALMLVTAGYFSYTTNIENETIETSYIEKNNEIIQEADNENEKNNSEAGEKEEESNIGDATLVNSQDVVEIQEDLNIGDVNLVNSQNVLEEDNDNEENGISEGDNGDVANTENIEIASNENDVKDNEDVNNNQTNSNDDSEEYFVNSKLERDQNYASMISSYSAMLENDSISETQKGIAMQEITEINEDKNAIMICENLISTKGFQNCVIFINDNSVNVVVKKDGGLTTESVAQIQNIVSREIGIKIENIHITEK